MSHFSGFVNIIGLPNVGKSTLMNVLLGEKMSIITNKPQTTRHRIIGIHNDMTHQIVFSDTPGYITEPKYGMQESMNDFVKGAFSDADIMILVIDITQPFDMEHPLFERLKKMDVPVFLILNKVDLCDDASILIQINQWKNAYPFKEIFPISALHQSGIDNLIHHIKELTPEGPPFYPKDQFTDRPERFFISEIIREKILLHYYQEIPYSCEVIVDTFKEDDEKELVRIHATIYVSRKSQKYILIGNKGSAIKQLGIDSRKSIELFLEKKVYLELFVKVKDNWRDDDRSLKQFGYKI